MGGARKNLMLPMRMFREVLAAREGSEDHWRELAGLTNVCGLYAQERRDHEWLRALMAGAQALADVEARHNRVGGRWAATEPEVAALTTALNVMDCEILPAMLQADFERLATKLNAMAAEEEQT